MRRQDTHPTVVATFTNTWEADLAAGNLADEGIPAWVETAGLDNPYRTWAGGMGLIRLFVPRDRVKEARSLLTELQTQLAEPEERQAKTARRAWLLPVGFIVVVASAVAAVPHGLRVPVALGALILYVIWRVARPARKGGGRAGGTTE